VLCITLSITPIADRDICSTGVSLHQVWMSQSAMNYLEHHTNCWQSYLFIWSVLTSGLEVSKCYALPWASHHLLMGIFVLMEYFLFHI